MTGVSSGEAKAVMYRGTTDFNTYEGDAASQAYRDMHIVDENGGIPFSNEARVNLTDAYQIRMAYAYFKSGKHEKEASFEVFFRTAPFGGQYVVLAGLDEVLRAINVFHFEESDFEYMKNHLMIDDVDFFEYLANLDMTKLSVYAQDEGSIVFPRTPLVQLIGPLIICQLLETMILNLMNFPSLIATNAMRMRSEAGKDKTLVEFGLRRAQGPDGAMSASRYSFMGGFDGTSNVRAAQIFGLPIMGTHAHAFVTSFEASDITDDSFTPVLTVDSVEHTDFKERCILSRFLLFDKLADVFDNISQVNDGEFAAFIAFAAAYPKLFIALVDTFDSISSGLPNFLAVQMTLQQYLPGQVCGLRLDSGDLAYLSKAIRILINTVSERLGLPDIVKTTIFASNDINETIIKALNDQKHEIDAFGIGTNLVTCQAQPALGLVYKLSSLSGVPKLKLSENIEKNSIPYKKSLYRFYSSRNEPLMDYLVRMDDAPPAAGSRVYARHLTNSNKRCYVIPDRVEPILKPVLSNGKRVNRPAQVYLDYLRECRQRALDGVDMLRKDVLRSTFPSPYKVSTSESFFNEIRELRFALTPIKTLQ
eukprot:GHVH01003252.1.p2 GENE.GHVH01003252.1~~GHVH01003252.1.p2  ORF type:complete len:591 (+),score=75.52 GHVH01003252.1:2355-4127(+)